MSLAPDHDVDCMTVYLTVTHSPIYTRMYTHIVARTNTYAHKCMQMCQKYAFARAQAFNSFNKSACTHTYAHTYTQTHTHTHIHTHTHSYTHKYIRTHAHKFTHILTCTCAYSLTLSLGHLQSKTKTHKHIHPLILTCALAFTHTQANTPHIYAIFDSQNANMQRWLYTYTHVNSSAENGTEYALL